MQDFAVPWTSNFVGKGGGGSQRTKPLQDENIRLSKPQMSLGNPIHCCRSVENAVRFGLTTR